MHDTSTTTRLRRWTALATAAATAMAGVLLAGAAPAAAATTYTYPVTSVTVGPNPFAVAVDPVSHKAYVAQFTNDTVSVVDTDTNTMTDSVAVGVSPYAVAVDPSTHKVYVANLGESGDGSVSVIDGISNTVTTLNVGGSPYAVVVDPGTHKAYVANSSSDSVFVIGTDPGTGADAVTATVTVGRYPSGIAVDPGTHKVYLGRFGNFLTVIDGLADTVATTLTVGVTPWAVAVNPVTHKVYVVSYSDRSLAVIGTDPDTGADVVDAMLMLPIQVQSLAVNSATNTIYLASSDDNAVLVLDGATNLVTGVVAVGSFPIAAVVDEVRNKIYVVNSSDNSVSIIDGATKDVTTATVGGSPSAIALDPGTGAALVTNESAGTLSVITPTVPTTTTVASSSSPTAGTPVTLTATVSPNPGGGTVAFTDGATPVDGCTAQPVDSATGEATCTLTLSAAGTHSITATYSGRTGYAASTASPLTLTVAAAPAPPAPPAASPATVSRVAGANRYATAAAASAAQFAGAAADAVVLASGASYPDALAGVPLATKKHAPLLLTNGAALPEATRTELRRVLPVGHTVYLLGGTAAVPTSIAAELTSLGYVIERIGGPNRNATALKVADTLGDPATVLLASGRDYPDALAAGPAAAKASGVVLFTDGSTLDAATTAYLAAHHGTVYAVGGAAAAANPAAVRIVGADRYATAATVANRFFSAPAHAGVASGSAFPDALSGGAQVAGSGGPLLLADPGHTDSATAYLSQVGASLATCTVFGGTGAVPDQIADTLTAALHR